MFDAQFWKGTAERAVATFIQAFLAAFVVVLSGVGDQAGLGDVDWLGALSIGVTAGILSVAKSFATPDFTAGSRPIDPDYGDGPVSEESQGA